MKSTSLKLVISILLVTAFVLPSFAEVAPLIQTQWRNYTWPYNAHYPEEPEGLNGHVGNACGPTSISHILKYYEFPVQGYGSLTFTTSAGHIWYADFGNTIYEWERMPNYLAPDVTEEEYDATAELVYHAAVSMHDVNGSGRNLEAIAEGLNLYFGYTDSAIVKNRWEHTLEEWNQFFYNELDSGRPIFVSGRTEDSPAPWEPGNYQGHYWICDGYNDEGQFHLVYGYGDYDYYYDQDNFGAHQAYNSILIGLKPMYLGGVVSLDETLEGHYIQAGNDLHIEWESDGDVESVRLVWSDSETNDWHTIAEDVDVTTGSVNWSVPDTLDGPITIRIYDQDEINIYDTAIIEVYSTISVELLQPNGGEYYQVGVVVPIYFQVNGSPAASIYYSHDNGSNWDIISENVNSGTGITQWTVPDMPSSEYLVKVVADLDNTVVDTSAANFSVGEVEIVGGPYRVDDNTLMHLNYNGNVENDGVTNQDGTRYGAATYSINNLPGLGQCLRLENTLDVNGSCVTIPYQGSLDLTGSWTIEGWFKAASIGNGVCAYPILVMLPGENQFFDAPVWISIDNDRNTIVARCYTTTGNGPSLSLPENSLQTDQWYHIAYIRDIENSLLKLVLHNSQRELIHSESLTFSSSILLDESEESIQIGGVSSSSNMQFDGWVDEFRFSNVVRSLNTSDIDGQIALESLPDEFRIISAYPNPFNPTLNIEVVLSEKGNMNLTIYNLLGKKVASLYNNQLDAGYHSFVFDGSHLSSGVYFLKASVPGKLETTRKVVLMK